MAKIDRLPVRRREAFIYGNFTYTHATDLLADLPLTFIAPFNGLTGLRYAPVG